MSQLHKTVSAPGGHIAMRPMAATYGGVIYDSHEDREDKEADLVYLVMKSAMGGTVTKAERRDSFGSQAASERSSEITSLASFSKEASGSFAAAKTPPRKILKESRGDFTRVPSTRQDGKDRSDFTRIPSTRGGDQGYPLVRANAVAKPPLARPKTLVPTSPGLAPASPRSDVKSGSVASAELDRTVTSQARLPDKTIKAYLYQTLGFIKSKLQAEIPELKAVEHKDLRILYCGTELKSGKSLLDYNLPLDQMTNPDGRVEIELQYLIIGGNRGRTTSGDMKKAACGIYRDEQVAIDDDGDLAVILSQVQIGMETYNIAPKIAEDGTGGSYFLSDNRKRKLAVFKPKDEEAFAPNNPRGYTGREDSIAFRPGVYSTQQASREVAAFVLDYGAAGVPPTTMVIAKHQAFNNGPSANQQPFWKQGSLQMFIEADDVSGNFAPSKFSVRNVHAIAMLDVRMINMDRNDGNMLVIDLGKQKERNLLNKSLKSERLGKCKYKLVPVDHGLALPDRLEVSEIDVVWMGWPQVKQPFHRDDIDFIQSLDPKKDAKYLEENLCFARGATRLMECTTRLLQVGSEAGLTLYDIGKLLYRSDEADMEHVPSKFGKLLAQVTQLICAKMTHALQGSVEFGADAASDAPLLNSLDLQVSFKKPQVERSISEQSDNSTPAMSPHSTTPNSPKRISRRSTSDYLGGSRKIKLGGGAEPPTGGPLDLTKSMPSGLPGKSESSTTVQSASSRGGRGTNSKQAIAARNTRARAMGTARAVGTARHQQHYEVDSLFGMLENLEGRLEDAAVSHFDVEGEFSSLFEERLQDLIAKAERIEPTVVEPDSPEPLPKDSSEDGGFNALGMPIGGYAKRGSVQGFSDSDDEDDPVLMENSGKSTNSSQSGDGKGVLRGSRGGPGTLGRGTGGGTLDRTSAISIARTTSKGPAMCAILEESPSHRDDDSPPRRTLPNNALKSPTFSPASASGDLTRASRTSSITGALERSHAIHGPSSSSYATASSSISLSHTSSLAHSSSLGGQSDGLLRTSTGASGLKIEVKPESFVDKTPENQGKDKPLHRIASVRDPTNQPLERSPVLDGARETLSPSPIDWSAFDKENPADANKPGNKLALDMEQLNCSPRSLARFRLPSVNPTLGMSMNQSLKHVASPRSGSGASSDDVAKLTPRDAAGFLSPNAQLSMRTDLASSFNAFGLPKVPDLGPRPMSPQEELEAIGEDGRAALAAIEKRDSKDSEIDPSLNTQVIRSLMPERCVWAENIGGRSTMEDGAYHTKSLKDDVKLKDGRNNTPDVEFFVVYDGHNGRRAVEYLIDEVPRRLWYNIDKCNEIDDDWNYIPDDEKLELCTAVFTRTFLEVDESLTRTLKRLHVEGMSPKRTSTRSPTLSNASPSFIRDNSGDLELIVESNQQPVNLSSGTPSQSQSAVQTPVLSPAASRKSHASGASPKSQRSRSQPLSPESSGGAKRGSQVLSGTGPPSNELSSGAVCAAVAIVNDESVVCAHVGDCRVLMCRNGELVSLTLDHRPTENQGEADRLAEMGVPVTSDGYVNDRVAVSRSFGDITIGTLAKLEGLICEPDVSVTKLTPEDEFLIVACDGVLEVMSEIDCVHLVRRVLRSTGDPEQAARELVNRCCINASDNLTAMVVMMKRPEETKRTAPKRRFFNSKKAAGSPGAAGGSAPAFTRPSWAV